MVSGFLVYAATSIKCRGKEGKWKQENGSGLQTLPPSFIKRMTRDHICTKLCWPRTEVEGSRLQIRNYYLFSGWWLWVSLIFGQCVSCQHRVRMTGLTQKSARRQFTISYKGWPLSAEWKAERWQTQRKGGWEKRLAGLSQQRPEAPHSEGLTGGVGALVCPSPNQAQCHPPPPLLSVTSGRAGPHTSAQRTGCSTKCTVLGQGWGQVDRKPLTLIWLLKKFN